MDAEDPNPRYVEASGAAYEEPAVEDWDFVVPEMGEHVGTLRCFTDDQLAAHDVRVRAAALLDFAKVMRDLAGQEDGVGPVGWPWTGYALAAVKAEEHASASAERSVGSPTPEVGTPGSDVDLWDLLGGPRAGFCCQDAYASASRGEELHTGGCPRRCSKWVRTQRGPVEFYPCGLTKDHAGDCWLHPAYRAVPSLPETQEGDTDGGS